jgi:hypothetical protein
VQRSDAGDGPASHAVMATVWRAVSRVQELLGHRILHWEDTPADDRLAEQLSMLATLHDWLPVTDSEAEDLVYLLGLYVEPAGDATRDSVSRAVTVTIRTMAVQRAGRTRIPPRGPI